MARQFVKKEQKDLYQQYLSDHFLNNYDLYEDFLQEKEKVEDTALFKGLVCVVDMAQFYFDNDLNNYGKDKKAFEKYFNEWIDWYDLKTKEGLTNNDNTQSIITKIEEKQQLNIKELKRKYKDNIQTNDGLIMAINKGYDDFLNDTHHLGHNSPSLIFYICTSTDWYVNEAVIWGIVNKFSNYKDMEKDDKFSAANLGYARSLTKFNPRSTNKFITYSTTVMTNDIIHERYGQIKNNRLFIKDKEVISKYDGEVVEIERVASARKIIHQGKPQQLFNVVISDINGVLTYYDYVYALDDDFKVGSKVKKGDLIGLMDGGYIPYASVDEYMDNPDTGDFKFNKIDSDGVELEGVDVQIINDMEQDYINKLLIDSIKELSKKEQDTVFKFLETGRQSKAATKVFSKLEQLLKTRGVSKENIVV